MKQIFSLGIVLLLIISCLPVVISSNSVSNRTIYVDDDGGKDYTKIQDAIDNASDGDTIFVYSGTYNENVFVDKTVDLIGEDKDNTVIDGSGSDVVLVTADCVNISRFTIRNGLDGICLYYCSGDIVCGNIITFNVYAGIHLIHSENCNVDKNIVTINSIGIVLHNSSNHNVIEDNNVKYNSEGILLDSSNYNRIEANEAVENNGNGIRLHNSSYNKLSQNNASIDNNGIVFENSSNYNTICDNNVAGNYIGILVGISSNNNTLFHNNILHNTVQVHIISECVNVWDNGYSSGGNYWSDYTGIDSNYDGLGDTPYIISGGVNNDRYPWMKPVCWTKLDIEITSGSTIVIRNIGDGDAYAIKWSVDIIGFVLIGRHFEGIISTLQVDEEMFTRLGFILGLGSVMLSYEVSTLNAGCYSGTANGMLVLFYLMLS